MVVALGMLLIGCQFLGCNAALAGMGLRHFKDWLVGCDNTLACRAVGLPADGAEGAYLVLDRPAGSDGKPVLRFETPDQEFGSDGAYYSVDGGKAQRLGKDAFAELPSVDKDIPAKTGLTDGTQLAQFLDAVKNGRALRFGAKADFAADAPSVSLDGLAATLLFIDDAQGRIGTETALSRKGTKPASAVPAAPVPPRIVGIAPPKTGKAPSAAPKGLWARHVRETRDGDCVDIGANKNLGPDGIEITRLAGGLLLYALPCWQAAYQGGTMYYLGAANDAIPKRLVFDMVDEKTGKIVANLSSVTNSSGLEGDAPARLAGFAKGRGIGDCGVQMDWTWTGKSFELSNYIVMPECRGVNLDDWIRLWQSKDK
jgi:hypothetical protein